MSASFFRPGRTWVLSVGVLVLVLPDGGVSGQGKPSGPAANGSADVVTHLLSKTAPIYRRYRGVRSLRTVTVRSYRDGQLFETTQLRTEHNEFFYKPAVQKILSATRNGTPIDPATLKQRKSQPPAHPILDERATSHYVLTMIGRKKIGIRECHVIRIRARRKGPRYINGTLYVTVKDLSLVQMTGSPTHYPTGLKSLSFRVHFTPKGMARSGRVTMRVYVPLLVPDTRIITDFQVTRSALFR